MAQDLKKAAQKMKKKGRFGDSELVHVNPAEKKMLMDMSGGITSKNPDTGLDEHFWSILIPAAIGAVAGGMGVGGGKKGWKSALKGAALGAAGGGLSAGLGSMANGGSFMSGLGGMFGEAGAGLGASGGSSMFGSLFGGGDAGGASSVLNNSSSFLPSNFSESMQIGNIGSAASSAAPVGLAEQSLGSRIGNFLSTPQGLTTASAALGLLTGDKKDPYADERERKKAEEKNYVRYNNGVPDARFAEGGAVDQNNPTPINFQKLSAYSLPTGGVGSTDFGKEVYTPKNAVAPAEPAVGGIGGAGSLPASTHGDLWLTPTGNIVPYNLLAQNYVKPMKGNIRPEIWTPEMWTAQGYSKYASGGSAKKGEIRTDSDVTRTPRPSPDSTQSLANAVRQMESTIGRRLDDDEVRDLIGRMGGGIGRAEPAYAEGGPVAGIGGGKDDKIKALLSDGEHVITADEVSMLGDGSNDAGHKKLYSMRKKLRKHKTGRTKQMPKAKSPESYAGIGA
jgi:hypothetical protein